MSKRSVEIKHIVIKVGEKEIPLSLEEAKELQDILNKTFGGEKVIEKIVHEHDHYYPWWEYQPYTYPRWTVTYPIYSDTTTTNVVKYTGDTLYLTTTNI